jgi:hypothetical protein
VEGMFLCMHTHFFIFFFTERQSARVSSAENSLIFLDQSVYYFIDIH